MIHHFYLQVWVGNHVCHVVRKSDHYFPDEIMALPFHPVVYLFLRGNRQSIRIYGCAYGKFTRSRTRK